MHRRLILIFAAAVTVCTADVNDDLLAASRKGDLAAVKDLIGKGASIETKTPYGQTPLYLAAMQGHRDVVDFLLDRGATTNVQDTFYKAPMLAFVMQRKHYDVAKSLIAKGAVNPDEILEPVAGSGNAELVQAVFDKGKPSQTALDKAYAASLDRKQTGVAEILKKAGAHEPAPPVQVDAKLLDSYAGMYKSDQIPLDIKIMIKEGQLVLQATGQPELPTKAKSPTLFEFAPARIEVDFDSAASFTLKQGGQNFKFKKVVTQ